MVKFYTTNQQYSYPFPAVTLAYFLRYPNPYSTHVLSTDVIERRFDAETQRLYTTRLHLKQSKLPSAILKLLPRGIITNKGSAGEAQNFILEKSVVDIKEGWMRTETRNLQYTGVLTVVEKQVYSREAVEDERTDVQTSVTFLSRFGQQKAIAAARKDRDGLGEEVTEKKKGFFSSWSTSALQRTIEATGMQRTRNALVKSKEGMDIVLGRLRSGGLAGVLEGMRRDREMYMAGAGAGAGAALVAKDTKWRKNGEE